MGQDAESPEVVHGSAVAAGSAGLLILGESGSGKSHLALELIALGAALVADDRIVLIREAGEPPLMSAPEAIAGLIEARGVGLIRLPHTTARLHMIVDLDETEANRLPHARTRRIGGADIPILSKVETPAFASILWLCLTAERVPL